jgi:transcription initiation factor TFIIE subunit alpha|tara:strand:+ start:602 stop:1228 length:627 start_codon:yes stop_codon:yes gene_type:complete
VKSLNLLDEVVTEIAGAEVVRLARILKKNKNVSEFRLTSYIKQEINVTRNMLYRLYEVNLVSFTRKKDKKKGWYIYYWTLNDKQLPYLYRDIVAKKIDRLNERLEREKVSQFFLCDDECVRLDFDQATEFDFKCPECNELLSLEDNSAKIADLEGQLPALEKILKTPLKVVKIPEPKVKKKKAKKAKKVKKAKKNVKKKVKKTKKKKR